MNEAYKHLCLARYWLKYWYEYRFFNIHLTAAIANIEPIWKIILAYYKNEFDTVKYPEWSSKLMRFINEFDRIRLAYFLAHLENRAIRRVTKMTATEAFEAIRMLEKLYAYLTTLLEIQETRLFGSYCSSLCYQYAYRFRMTFKNETLYDLLNRYARSVYTYAHTKANGARENVQRLLDLLFENAIRYEGYRLYRIGKERIELEKINQILRQAYMKRLLTKPLRFDRLKDTLKEVI